MPKQFTALLGRSLSGLLLSASVITTVAGAPAGQNGEVARTPEARKTVVRESGSNVSVRTYTEIPAATEQASPDEWGWWERVRKAGNDLQKNDDEKLRKKFYLLLYEGQQKAYRVPLKDRPSQMLAFSKPTYTILARERKIKGNLVLSVEYLADGSVGDVRLINGVDSYVDRYVIQARRRDVFLPAVKDGVFVPDRREVKDQFNMRD